MPTWVGLWKVPTMLCVQRRTIQRLAVVMAAIWKPEVFVSLLGHVYARWMSWLVVRRQALAVALTVSVCGLRLCLHAHSGSICRQEAGQTTGHAAQIWNLTVGTTARRFQCVAALTYRCTTTCTAMSRAHLQ